MFPTAIALALALSGGPAASAQDPAPTPQTAAPIRQILVLTVDEAVQRALENNADLAVEKFSPESAVLSITDAEAAYEPTLTSTIQRTSRTNKAANTQAGAGTVDNANWIYNCGATKLCTTGGTPSPTTRSSTSSPSTPIWSCATPAVPTPGTPWSSATTR